MSATRLIAAVSKTSLRTCKISEFRKLGAPYFGVRIIRILLSRVLYQSPPFSETLISLIKTMLFLKAPQMLTSDPERQRREG